MASRTAVSEATTGSTLYPVMNLMSSMAKTLVGSVIAIVSVAPERLSGIIWYLWAVSAGISLMMPGSISNWVRLMEGTPYCLLRSAVISSSLTKPSFSRLYPSFPPLVFWYDNASCNCAGVMRFSFSNKSPMRTGIVETLACERAWFSHARVQQWIYLAGESILPHELTLFVKAKVFGRALRERDASGVRNI